MFFERIAIRNDFYQLGLEDILIHIQDSEPSDDVFLQLDTFYQDLEVDEKLKDVSFSDPHSVFDGLLKRISDSKNIDSVFKSILRHIFLLPLDNEIGLRKWFLVDKIISTLANEKDDLHVVGSPSINIDELLIKVTNVQKYEAELGEQVGKNVVLEKQLNITQEKYKEVKRLSENFDEILKRKESEMQENVGKAISSEVERTLSNNINEVKELKEHVKTLKENEDVYKKTIEDLGTKEKSKSDEYQALTEKYNTFEVTMLQKIAKENEDNSKHIEQLNLEITNLQREMSNRDIHAIEKSLENEKSTGKYQLLEEQLDNLKKNS